MRHPFLTLVLRTATKDLSSLTGAQNVHVEDQIWRIAFIKGARSNVLILAALPFDYLYRWRSFDMGFGFLFTDHSHAWARDCFLAKSLQDANVTLKAKIDAEKHMAEALRESEQRYRAIFENASIGIYQISPTGLWINANRTMAEIVAIHRPRFCERSA